MMSYAAGTSLILWTVAPLSKFCQYPVRMCLGRPGPPVLVAVGDGLVVTVGLGLVVTVGLGVAVGVGVADPVVLGDGDGGTVPGPVIETSSTR